MDARKGVSVIAARKPAALPALRIRHVVVLDEPLRSAAGP